MMEFEYSPRHSTSASLHLLSPTHAHTSPIPGFPSIKDIRRSLSRSPSKPQRHSPSSARLGNTSPVAQAPLSGLSRAVSANAATDVGPHSRYLVKRVRPLRSGSRRTSPSSPQRRALSDSTTQANVTPQFMRRSSQEDGQENQESMDCSTERANLSQEGTFDEPIKIDFLKPDRLLQPIISEHVSPMKSSPLKRSDGVMNLEAAGLDSPRTKRRSLHGASFGGDFNVFDQGFDGTQSDSARSSDERDRETTAVAVSTWPMPSVHSPHRRPFSLRKSTLQQRTAPGRTKLSAEVAREPTSSPALSRARSRISLDGALPLRSLEFDSPLRRGALNEPPVLFPPAAQKPYQSAPKPHPLSHALTPSSSASSIADEQSGLPQLSPVRNLPQLGFSKSLPIGATRHLGNSQTGSDQMCAPDSFATPAAFKMARPLPQAFMSTGLISKRNRNMDMADASFFGNAHMPDTPSKKAAHMHIASPKAVPSVLGRASQPIHEFGSPTTPFNARGSRVLPESIGKSVSVFGSRVGAQQFTRRGSFVSIDGDDINNSPTVQSESQASVEDLPPTPTKSTTSTRPQSKGKSNSLRSSLFGRRTSLGPDTFASPATEGEVSVTDPDPTNPKEIPDKQSPHTPLESFTPPDPSNLSISADRRPSVAFSSSNYGFPPATPTGPRESFGASLGQGHVSSGYFANDVDTSLTARFGQITSSGIGEFSQVYRVEKPHTRLFSTSPHQPNPSGGVWAVKKSRRPYTGNKDRQRKMREVQILKALRGHEHIIELVDEWESKNHLYIQTEYCENGNLKDFLTSTGFKGRLDDFRIWKILLELSQGVQSIHDTNFIHLDLKPANVFIDWEGVLKIGDFGMASAWPAPVGLDGEGDREYIGPEVLSGRFDKPADIFALGMIMLEIAGNIVLPDNGTSWQRLRAGDMSDLPSLTWSSESSLVRDESGDPVELLNGQLPNSLCASNPDDDDDLGFLRPTVPTLGRTQNLVQPPNFMVDHRDPQALDQIVQWMIRPDPDMRPVIDQLLAAGGVQWVDRRRRAGATVYEGNWGPADDVLNHEQDVEMADL